MPTQTTTPKATSPSQTTVPKPLEVTNFTFQDGNNFTFQDGNNFVFDILYSGSFTTVAKAT